MLGLLRTAARAFSALSAVASASTALLSQLLASCSADANRARSAAISASSFMMRLTTFF